MNNVLVLCFLSYLIALSFAKTTPEACLLPNVWSSDLVIYIGPGAVNCPYNDTAVYGSVTYDLEHQVNWLLETYCTYLLSFCKAVRFDVLKGGKGPSSGWVFYDSAGAHWYHYNREARTCKNGTYQGTIATLDLKKDATFKSQFSIGTQIEEAWKFNNRDASKFYSQVYLLMILKWLL
jgi:hypothetical protein